MFHLSNSSDGNVPVKPNRCGVPIFLRILFILFPLLNLCTSSTIKKSICCIHDMSCFELCKIPKLAIITLFVRSTGELPVHLPIENETLYFTKSSNV